MKQAAKQLNRQLDALSFVCSLLWRAWFPSVLFVTLSTRKLLFRGVGLDVGA